MLNFDLKVPNTERLFFALQSPLKDFTPVWRAERPVLSAMVPAQIKSSGSRGPHGPFAPLTREYAARKAKLYPGAGILVASGRMLASFAGGEGAVFQSEPRRMLFGSDVPYALYLQTGTRRMVARRPIDPAEEDKALLRSTAVRTLRAIYRRVGAAVARRAYGPGESFTGAELASLGRSYLESGGGSLAAAM